MKFCIFDELTYQSFVHQFLSNSDEIAGSRIIEA
jgi:hypothetical protein